VAVKSISFGSPHARCTPTWALGTCGEPNDIKVIKEMTRTGFNVAAFFMSVLVSLLVPLLVGVVA